jgi:hypothetical protein
MKGNFKAVAHCPRCGYRALDRRPVFAVSFFDVGGA